MQNMNKRVLTPFLLQFDRTKSDLVSMAKTVEANNSFDRSMGWAEDEGLGV
jgi:hypothetical protein